MATTTLNDLLLLLQDNPSGNISGADMQVITTELWGNSVISSATDGNFAIFDTDVHTNVGVLVDTGMSPSTLPLSDASIAALGTKIELPVAVGAVGDVLRYNGAGFTWETPSKTTVNLANVDDTSDLLKPVSNDTQAALDGKQDSLPADANGYLHNDGAGTLSWSLVSGAGATELNELSDVVITAISSGDALMHNGSTFVNRILTKADISDFSGGDYATSAQGALADSATQITATDTINVSTRTISLGSPTDTVVNLATTGTNVDIVLSADVRTMDDLRFVIPHVADPSTLGLVDAAENKGVILLDTTENVVKINNGTEWVNIEESITTSKIEPSICSMRANAHTVAVGAEIKFENTLSDPHTSWDDVNSYYVAPADGHYYINVSVELTSQTSPRSVTVYIDGNPVPNTVFAADGDSTTSQTYILPMLATQVLSFRNSDSLAIPVNENTQISIYRIT